MKKHELYIIAKVGPARPLTEQFYPTSQHNIARQLEKKMIVRFLKF